MIIRTRLLPFILVFASLLLAFSAAAQTPSCSDYTFYLRWVARDMPPPGPFSPQVNAVKVEGDLAYVAAGSAGLAVYDVTDPAEPVLLGMADTPYFAMDVDLDGDHAYVADWHSPGFCVVDVSDPHAPALVGSEGNTSYPNYWKVAVAVPDTVYVIDHYVGVRVVDVTDPANPDLIGLIPIGGYSWDLEVQDGYLYVADDVNGVHVFDMSASVLNPTPVSTCLLPSTTSGLDVVGNFAYAACNREGLQIISLYDKADPRVVGVLDYPGDATLFIDVHVANDLATVVCSGGSYDQEGLLFIDVSEAKEPRIVNALGTYYQYASRVFSTGSHAYLAALGKGWFVADLTNPRSPAFISSFTEEDYLPRAVAARGDHAFVLDSLHGLRVMDLTTSPAAAVLAQVDLPGDSHQIVLQGDLAYVADGSSGLRIVDVAAPTAPVPRGSISPFGAQYDVAVAGDFAYVASDQYGMHVIDVSDPDLPVERGDLDPSFSGARAIDVAGGFGFLACGFDGLYAIDLADPDLPVEVGHLTFDGDAANVYLKGTLAYVAGYDNGVYLVDVSDPAAMTLVSTLVTPGYALGVVPVGDLAYIADNEGGLQIADYSDPAHPRFLGCVEIPGQRALDLAVEGQRVCIAGWEGGFHVLPAHCVASGVDGGPPSHASGWLTAYPNPFNPRTTFAFDLSGSETVRITVYSLDGRPVRRLAGREYPAGPHGVTWDGRDDRGRRLPSGSYVVEMEAGTSSRKGRVTLLK